MIAFAKGLRGKPKAKSTPLKNLSKVFIVGLFSINLTTVLLAECKVKEILDMHNSGFSDEQIQRICGDTNSIEQKQNIYKEPVYNENYFTLEGGLVSQGGPGFITYPSSYGEAVDELSVDGSGFNLGVSYIFNSAAELYLRYKSLSYEFEDDYGNIIDELEVSETILGYSGIANSNGSVSVTFGAFIGLGSTEDKYGESISFFTYGPQIGLNFNTTENLTIYTRLTWQERSYSKSNGIAFNNFPFGAELGLKINFK